MIRNSETKIWRAIRDLKSRFFFGLSGTIIENKLDDLYSIAEVVRPGCLGPMWHFQDCYQNVSLSARNKIIFSGAKNIDHLKARLANCLFSVDVNVSPTPVQTHIVCPKMTPEQTKIHDEYWASAKNAIAQNLSSGAANPP
jgi:SNF2 family DNA or RNA helicase